MSKSYLPLNGLNIVFDGNSITAGDSIPAGPLASISEQMRYQLVTQGIWGATITNVAVSGQTCKQMIDDASTQVRPLLVPSRFNVLIVNEGGNDIVFGGSAQLAYDNMRNYCLLRRSEGWYVLVWSCPHRRNDQNSVPGTVALYESILLDYNNRLKACWKEFADQFMDTRLHFPYYPTVPFPGPAGEWIPDAVHPSAIGNALLAAKLISHLKYIPIRKAKDMPSITYRFGTVSTSALVIPAGYARMRGYTIGGGGGGGSGRKGSAGTARFGGGGGSASARNDFDLELGSLGLGAGSALTVVVGAGGPGGSSQTGNSGNGFNGAAGSTTSIAIGSAGSTVFVSNTLGGNGGGGGTAATGGGGSLVQGQWPSGSGGSSLATATANAGSSANVTAGSSGAGGGISTANAAFAGGAGGRGSNELDRLRAQPVAGAINTGLPGANGGVPANNTSLPGDGGAGGGGSTTSNAGTGGNGGGVGSSGGGGGAATDGVGNSGAGGNGATGIAVITFY